jgi:hypothetical protein
MELKVVCYCGQKYKFDVEPVNGRMPHTISCPVCAVDGTTLANQLISQQLSGSVPPPLPAMAAPVTSAPAAPVPVMTAPAPAMAVPAMAAPAPMQSGLRINRPIAAPVPPPLAPGSAVPPPLPSSRPVAPVKPLMSKPLDAPKDFKMGLGILGAILGAVVGGGLMFGFFYMTGFRFPLTGTAIGVLSGVGARVLARGTDSTLGAIAAAISLATIVGLFFLMYGEFYVLGIFSVFACTYFAYRIASG